MAFALEDCNLGKNRPQDSSSLEVWVCVFLISAALSEKQHIGNAHKLVPESQVLFHFLK